MLATLLSGCAEPPSARARIDSARTVPGPDGRVLELTQQLTLSEAMREALDHGIALRLRYDIQVCGRHQQRALWLRQAPLSRRYELQYEGDEEIRGFARLNTLLAALDRIRLVLDLPSEVDCPGQVQVRLDLAALPTPLRFPAFARPAHWHLASAPQTWTGS